MKNKPIITSIFIVLIIALNNPAWSEDFTIDTEGAHAFIQFKIPHLGYSMLLGRFNKFTGEFSYDEKNPEKASIQVEIDTASLDSNHAKRDKHLRSDEFLDVAKYPKASFVSKSYSENGDGTGKLSGDLTLHGVTKQIEIATKKIGNGPDPWGGYRRGFEGTTSLVLADYGINYDLGPASKSVELYLSFEGIRK